MLHVPLSANVFSPIPRKTVIRTDYEWPETLVRCCCCSRWVFHFDAVVGEQPSRAAMARPDNPGSLSSTSWIRLTRQHMDALQALPVSLSITKGEQGYTWLVST